MSCPTRLAFSIIKVLEVALMRHWAISSDLSDGTLSPTSSFVTLLALHEVRMMSSYEVGSMRRTRRIDRRTKA